MCMFYYCFLKSNFAVVVVVVCLYRNKLIGTWLKQHIADDKTFHDRRMLKKNSKITSVNSFRRWKKRLYQSWKMQKKVKRFRSKNSINFKIHFLIAMQFFSLFQLRFFFYFINSVEILFLINLSLFAVFESYMRFNVRRKKIRFLELIPNISAKRYLE